jgi:hypothetical protein
MNVTWHNCPLQPPLFDLGRPPLDPENMEDMDSQGNELVGWVIWRLCVWPVYVCDLADKPTY